MYISFSHHRPIDQEHLRIIKQLQALGIEPSGYKSTDKVKLERAKEAELKKCENKFEIEEINRTEKLDLEKSQLEEERLGANIWADYNKIYFGL